MDDLILKLKDDGLFKAQIHLLIQMYATQGAIASLLIHRLSDNEDEKNKLFQLFQNEATKHRELIFHTLIEEYGSVDLNDVLGSGSKH